MTKCIHKLYSQDSGWLTQGRLWTRWCHPQVLRFFCGASVRDFKELPKSTTSDFCGKREGLTRCSNKTSNKNSVVTSVLYYLLRDHSFIMRCDGGWNWKIGIFWGVTPISIVFIFNASLIFFGGDSPKEFVWWSHKGVFRGDPRFHPDPPPHNKWMIPKAASSWYCGWGAGGVFKNNCEKPETINIFMCNTKPFIIILQEFYIGYSIKPNWTFPKQFKQNWNDSTQNVFDWKKICTPFPHT